MKRTLAIVFIALIITSLLTGCGSSSESVDNTEETVQQEETVAGLVTIDFSVNDYGVRSYIMYDPETYVMYVLVRDGSNAASTGGMSVLYNADGTLRLYDPSAE